MTTRVRWSSMPRVSRLQDEEDNDWIQNGYEDTDGSHSVDDNEELDCGKRGPNHGSNVCPDETGRIPLTVGDNRYVAKHFLFFGFQFECKVVSLILYGVN
ncbi:unnamed protein product [Fraxinus pennsylvanica]|uniref:Uncharacterized protein n=1 Tax=Fraxinus pennsylvanica TaxID=56036 RepID=A0AAD1YL33_9LAMI|nr:unnamed protein product [Fraxinus pennsylvanica]